MPSKSEASVFHFAHVMIRVRDLDRSIAFYQNVLGMTVRRRADYPDGRYTLVFLSYGPGQAEIELTQNWGNHTYTSGSAFGHLAIGVDSVERATQLFQSRGANVLRPAGPRIDAPDEIIAFIEDPDQYRIELVQIAAEAR